MTATIVSEVYDLSALYSHLLLPSEKVEVICLEKCEMMWC